MVFNRTAIFEGYQKKNRRKFIHWDKFMQHKKILMLIQSTPSDHPYSGSTLFSFLIGNAGMHLKNFSLVYPVNGMVQLAPAYDLLSTRLLISEKDDPEEMAFTLNCKKRKITLNDFIKFAKNLGLDEKQFQNIMKRFFHKIQKISPEIENKLLPCEKTAELNKLLFERAFRLGFTL
ncbi:MAG: HipA domain-containing protein [Proteobacteria bacterium]|nr:HipA domain-containing protein [Pseudomonadota bacterium]